MKTNSYTFKNWDGNASAWYLIEVEAPDVKTAYNKALKEANNAPSMLFLVRASTLQIWEAAITSAEVGIERFFVQAYTHAEATLSAEKYMAEWFSDSPSAKLFYVLEELKEVK